MSRSVWRSDNPAAGMTYGALAALIWGAWPVFSRLGVNQTLTPLDIAALRFGVAGLILLPLVWRHATKGLGWKRAVLLSCGAGVPYVLVMVSGLSLAPAGHAGVITPSCMLLFSTVGSRLFLGDTLSSMRIVGLGIIVVGVALIGWNGLAQMSGRVWLGDLLFVCGGFLWASYTVSTRVWRVEPVHATALVSVISMVAFVPLYAVFGEPRILSAPGEEVLFQAVFQGVFAAVLALIFYTRSVAILGAGRGAIFAALVPGVAVMLAYPVLGEEPTVQDLLGVAVVSLGMGAALELFRFARGPRYGPSRPS